MLSFAEKRSLQRIVQDKLTELENGSLSFQQKRTAQRELEDALSRLTGDAAGSGSLYDELVAGKFLQEAPINFLSILKKVLVEINDNVQMLHEPVIAYIKANLGMGVLESAGSTVALLAQYKKPLPDKLCKGPIEKMLYVLD